MQATELYSFVKASQPTVSRRLGVLLDQRVVSVRHAPDDRRYNIYALNPISMWKGVEAQEIRVFGRLASLISNQLRPAGVDGHGPEVSGKAGEEAIERSPAKD